MAEREDKFRTHRIIQIDEDIRSGIYPGIQFLMDKHGVSRRTILRDIEFLRDRYQAPIECDRRRPFYCKHGNALNGTVQKHSAGKSVPPHDGKNQRSASFYRKRGF